MSDPMNEEHTNEVGAADAPDAVNQPVSEEPGSTASSAPVEPSEAAVDTTSTPAPANPYSAPRASYAAPQQPDQATSNEPHHTRTALFVLVVIIGLVAGAISGVTASYLTQGANNNNTASSTTNTNTNTSKDASTGVKTTNTTAGGSLTQVINSKLSSIVTVSIVTNEGSGTGSGVVIDNKGDIVTNAHVATLEGASATGTLTVRTSSDNTYKASLVAYDATADVAVIKVPATAKGLTPITFANSDNVQVGDTAIAIGSPLGLSGTVTAGIVSALNRPIDVQSAAVTGNNPNSAAASTATVALSAIQTDAAINEGNSGGALLDANGNLIGLNDAIATSGDSSGSIGIGFSIPGNYVKRIAEELISTGKAEHGYLGVSLSDYVPSGAAFESGAQIKAITANGPAAKAGLQSGDIITQINNTVIESATQATAIVKQNMPGSKVTMTYTRNGSSHTTTVTLGTLAQS